MAGKNTVVIIGGGVAGVRAALEQAKAGKKVYLVGREASVAGESILPGESLAPDDLFTGADLAELRQNSNIEVITNAEVKRVAEKDGGFKVRVRQKPARVIDGECDNFCNALGICPVSLEDETNGGLTLRTAIDFSNREADVYNIVRENMPICQQTCPVHLDVRGYVGLIADGKFEESLALIRQRLPFPGVCGRICTHPCELVCNRGIQDQAIAIRSLRRFVCDYEIKSARRRRPPARPNPREEKVAIIGAGPAGLTCANDLASKGYRVTVFEALPVVGGMLAVGVPEYRLPREILQREVDAITDLGVEIKTGTPIGKDLSIDDLFGQGFKAVFVAVGAHLSQKLGVPGEDAEMVINGVDFLREMNLGKKVKIGEKVGVIGGGNVAIDAARSALRIGAKKVFLLYRRTRQEMPATEEEIEAAEEEGVEIQYLVAPAEVLVSGGKAKGIKCTRMELGEPDASGRRRPVPVKGSEFDIELDTIIPAIGQATDVSFLGKGGGIETTRRDTFLVDPDTLATTRDGVFAGGDAVTGPATAIGAIAAGHKAADSIIHYLGGE
ncbi:MAG: FAD-dependent oxidoreductase [Dehalococcoidales bacterium]|nr:FAD-dependent oxidoreductase [Dehalococcoidales bacterium]